MRILLAEDSERLQRSIGEGLRRAGYAVDVSPSGTDALWRASGCDYDVIVLDIMLPGIDGLEVLRQLRGRDINSHVLLLTARDTIADRVAGLRTGADDYLVKPFAFDELLARVEALGRRQRGKKNPMLRVADLDIDTIAREVRRGNQTLPLLPREFSLLHYLACRVGEVVTRTEIEMHLYDDRVDPMSNVVDSAICSLRRKIDLPGEPSLIVTRRRMGYVLSDPGPVVKS